MRLLLSALALAALAVGASAQDIRAGDLAIRAPMIRAVPAGVPNSAGYMTIANGGGRADLLVSASCTCARSVEVHQSHVMNGAAMMMAVPPLNIPAGGQITFAPGGYHLMISGLKTALVDGSVQPLTLKFQHAGAVVTPFQVRSRIPSLSARAG